MTSEVLPNVVLQPAVAEVSNVYTLPGVDEAALYSSAYAAQQAALCSLPDFSVSVKHRSQHAEPQTTEHGRFYQESVRYSDGAVRLVTLGMPNRQRSDYPIVSGDPWFTGPSGFNRIEIEQLVALGYPVIWSHHHGRQAIMPTSLDRINTTLKFLSSKSVGKSAAQDHALLDHLADSSDFKTGEVIRKGYSRSAMAGEAFLALSERANRKVLWSDLEAACFARRVGHIAFLKLLSQQLPYELKALHDISSEARDDSNDDHTFLDYLGSVDLNPLDMTHEVAWLRLLLSGDAGKYAQAVGLDAKGVRTIYKHDYASQQTDWRRIHAPRQGISIIEESGAHLSGATRHMQAKKIARYTALRTFAESHGGRLDNVSFVDVLPPAM